MDLAYLAGVDQFFENRFCHKGRIAKAGWRIRREGLQHSELRILLKMRKDCWLIPSTSNMSLRRSYFFKYSTSSVELNEG